MRFPFKVTALLGSLIGCVAAEARVNETRQQCEERYGKPTETREAGSTYLYAKESMLLLVHFHESKCDHVMYMKPERDALGTPKAFSENERDFLLKANGGDREWKVLGKNGVTVVFETADRAFRAQYDIAGHTLVIFTQEGGKRMHDARKDEEEKKLKGL